MLICRCAWHRRYRGYPRLGGVASWRGWNVRFTDGICDSCLARFRAEHRRFLEPREPGPARAKPAAPAVAPAAATAATSDAVA